MTKKPAMRIPALALACLLAAPAAAETRQHGNLIFDPPQGWAVGAVLEDGTLVLKSDLPNDECRYCRIYLSTGDEGALALDRYLAAQTLRFADPDPDDTEPPQVEALASEMIDLNGHPAGLQGQKLNGDLQVLVALELTARMELIGFETGASDEAQATADLGIFERDVMPMIEGASFVSEGATPLMPAPQPGSLTGVYWGTSTWWMLGIDGMMQMQIDHRWLTFWPDGLFYDGTPPAGTAAFDRAALLAEGDMNWGSYNEADGTLILSFASGVTESLTVSGSGLAKGDSSLFPVELLTDGTKIDGSVSTFFYSGFTPGSGVTGGASSAGLTEFHPDGSWTHGSSGGAFGSFETGSGLDPGGGYAASSESETAGRYEVKDGLVIQYGKDGTVRATRYIFRAGSDIWIGSEVLASG